MTGNGFVRVKLLQVELLPGNGAQHGTPVSWAPGGPTNASVPGQPPTKYEIVDPFCVVNLKEAEEIPGSLMHILVKDRPNRLLADLLLPAQVLADKCRDGEDVVNIWEEPKVAGGITRRRGAIKHQKIYEVKGHKFIEKFFRQPTFCAFCKEFLCVPSDRAQAVPRQVPGEMPWVRQGVADDSGKSEILGYSPAYFKPRSGVRAA
ncbi:hypothetical protein IscW_ISCW007465 [Ixodes scapularis]|uniref:Uncharacterized protein n=1 Tax=Ixodes scapularis TaxID=6945 RepID=B7PUJ4_IXOSC|nr:hypothetical protein IscW_ISCW007465 [Ixodes scapularis]|eukprot:XP_002406172.1 hypothetical protein IscW_ISCW007465 [Ixodes scapularis]